MASTLDYGDPFQFSGEQKLGNLTTLSSDDINVTFTTPAPEMDETFKRVKDAMFMTQYFLLPFFLVTGLFGNIFTIATMASSRFQHMTSRYILIFLAISDTVLLVTQPFNKLWIIRLFGFDFRALSRTWCKVFFVIFKSAKMTSSWLVVLLCFERYVAVVFPLKAKMIIRKRFIFPAIALDYIVLLTYNSVWNFSSDIVDGICKPDNPSLKQKVFVTIGTTLYSLMPTALLLIFTPQIIVRLIHQRNIRRGLSTRSGNMKSSGNNSNTRSKKDKEMFRASVMVLGVMIAYIVLIIPISAVHLYAFTAGVSAFDTGSLGFFIFREIAQMLEQINYAVNFFLYVLCSYTFRQRVKEILCFTAFRKKNDLSSILNRESSEGSKTFTKSTVDG